MFYDIYAYQRIQDKHVHNIVHKKDINKLTKLIPFYYLQNVVSNVDVLPSNIMGYYKYELFRVITKY